MTDSGDNLNLGDPLNAPESVLERLKAQHGTASAVLDNMVTNLRQLSSDFADDDFRVTFIMPSEGVGEYQLTTMFEMLANSINDEIAEARNALPKLISALEAVLAQAEDRCENYVRPIGYCYENGRTTEGDGEVYRACVSCRIHQVINASLGENQ